MQINETLCRCAFRIVCVCGGGGGANRQTLCQDSAAMNLLHWVSLGLLYENWTKEFSTFKEGIGLYKFLCYLSEWGQLLKERNCSKGSNFFLLRVDPMEKRTKNESSRIASASMNLNGPLATSSVLYQNAQI